MDNWFRAFREIPASIKTGYALMALAFVIFALFATTGRLEQDQIFFLTAGMIFAGLACVFLLRRETISAEDHKIGAQVDLISVIESSNIPMYFLNGGLVMESCNTALARLANLPRGALEGQHISKLIDRLENQIPQGLRKAYRKRQDKLMTMLPSELAPHSEETIYIDNREYVGNDFDGVYKVIIHADKVYVGPRAVQFSLRQRV